MQFNIFEKSTMSVFLKDPGQGDGYTVHNISGVRFIDLAGEILRAAETGAPGLFDRTNSFAVDLPLLSVARLVSDKLVRSDQAIWLRGVVEARGDVSGYDTDDAWDYYVANAPKSFDPECPHGHNFINADNSLLDLVSLVTDSAQHLSGDLRAAGHSSYADSLELYADSFSDIYSPIAYVGKAALTAIADAKALLHSNTILPNTSPLITDNARSVLSKRYGDPSV